jgi:mannose-1-phosphate guanylyltransferase
VVDGCLVRRGAHVADSALVAASYVGSGSVVREGASITRSVVLDGATIEAGAVVEGSIVGWDAVVGAGSSLAPITIVGPHAKVAPCGHHEGERIPA